VSGSGCVSVESVVSLLTVGVWSRFSLDHALAPASYFCVCLPAISSHLSVLMSIAFMPRLQTSLKRKWGCPSALFPHDSSPYCRSFGIQPCGGRGQATEECIETRYLSAMEDLCVGNTIAPLDVSDTPHTGPVDCCLGVGCEFVVLHTLLVRRAHVVDARPIRRFISDSRERLSVIVEPR
jgi:hypothetical protein